MPERIPRIEALLQREVSSVIQRGLGDPRMRGLVSVTRVKCGSDMRDATIFISVLPEEHEKLTLQALRHASQHIRTEAGKRIATRIMPRLTFKLDDTIKKLSALAAAIHQGVERTGIEDTTAVETPE